MKKVIAVLSLVFVLLGLNNSSIAQTQVSDEEVFQVVDEGAMFPQGKEAMTEFLAKNLKYPEKAIKDSIAGRVFVSFIVEKDGSLSNIKVIRDIGGGCGEEAIRVMKLMPKWTPAKVGNKLVRQQYYMPIEFRLAKK
jgi:TonB family protein